MISVIDYGVGNLHSVSKALERVGASVRISRDPADVATARGIVLPGVGAFRDSMDALHRSRLAGAVRDAVRSGKPFLGICLGLQMLFTESEEFGVERGLDIFPGRVVRFREGLKVPHLGWNRVRAVRDENPLFCGVPQGSYFYFVHSYYGVPEDPSLTAAVADYGGDFCCMVWRGNVFATQFHPEKSQKVGLRLLENFKNYVEEAGSPRNAYPGPPV